MSLSYLRAEGNFKIASGDTTIGSGTEYSPQSLKVGLESLASEDSGRVDSGKMVITYIYEKVRKIEIEMPPMDTATTSALLQLVQGKKYTITYVDPITGAERKAYVYTSNSSADCYGGMITNGLWTGVAFNAIEIEGEVS